MQDAYIQEHANEPGNWEQIGYTGPGTKNNASSYSSNVFDYTGTADATSPAWKAKPKNGKLNDCDASNNAHFWALAVSATDGVLTITDASTADVCKALTTSWDNLMRNAN